MKSLLNVSIVLSLLYSPTAYGQIKNARTQTVKIAGNCEMCKQSIEDAANKKNNVLLTWNKDTKQAILSYDSTKTHVNDILRRVAYAGYDNELFFAPDDAYEKLPSCCKYERAKTTSIKMKTGSSEITAAGKIGQDTSLTKNQLQAIFDSYIELKNALIQANAGTASLKAKSLSQGISLLKMEQLESAQHKVWMSVDKELITTADDISQTTDIEQQRMHFIRLSENMHKIMTVAKLKTPVYYQHCPMYNDGKGANWLSTETTVKNPYYGSQMLNCGKTIETIQ